MTLAEATEQVTTRAANVSAIDATLKFIFNENEVIYVDGTTGNTVSNEQKDASCNINIEFDDFVSMLEGNLNPMSAFMEGKMKVEGDMSVAMKLQSILS